MESAAWLHNVVKRYRRGRGQVEVRRNLSLNLPTRHVDVDKGQLAGRRVGLP